MIKRSLLLTFILLIPLGAFLYYRQTPEQLIYRQIDRLLESVEHRRISTRRQIDVHKALEDVLADQVTVLGEAPLPNGEFSLDQIKAEIDKIHLLTNFIEISLLERRCRIIKNKAQVYQTIKIRAASGIGSSQYKNEEIWVITIDLNKKDDWRITRISGSRS